MAFFLKQDSDYIWSLNKISVIAFVLLHACAQLLYNFNLCIARGGKTQLKTLEMQRCLRRTKRRNKHIKVSNQLYLTVLTTWVLALWQHGAEQSTSLSFSITTEAFPPYRICHISVCSLLLLANGRQK